MNNTLSFLSFSNTQMVLLILGCFTICWLPYFIVACSQIYKITGNSSAVAYMAAFTLAMSNSAMNPVIYAWKNSNFRVAFINLLKCKSPDTLEPSQSMRSNLHRKSSSAQHQESISGAFPNYSTPPFAKRNEPIASMGITFEEDEDILTQTQHDTLKPKSTSYNHTNQPAVTIKIESDMRRNSVIISTTTLPSTDVITMQDDTTMAEIVPSLDVPFSENNKKNNKSAIIRTLDSTLSEIKQKNSLVESTQEQHNNHSNNKMDGTITGNLIVNKLIEDYEYDSHHNNEEVIKKFKENLLNSNGGTLSIIGEDSKRKSKSTNSIVITKCPNKSKSHGSIYNSSLSDIKKEIAYDKNKNESSIQLTNEDCNGISQNKNLLTTFHFGKKYISKSFNTAVENMEKCNSEKLHHQPA